MDRGTSNRRNTGITSEILGNNALSHSQSQSHTQSPGTIGCNISCESYNHGHYHRAAQNPRSENVGGAPAYNLSCRRRSSWAPRGNTHSSAPAQCPSCLRFLGSRSVGTGSYCLRVHIGVHFVRLMQAGGSGVYLSVSLGHEYLKMTASIR